ncbi:hypothetical protein C0J52_18325 [Blattella germanica]|nr:hypothetical protein C0J52_18325 [Blattella germanica]
MSQSTAYNTLSQLMIKFSKITDDQLNSKQVQEFIRRSNNTKFDLVFLEKHTFQAYHGLIHLLGSPPVIGILMVMFGQLQMLLGLPQILHLLQMLKCHLAVT